MKKNVLSSRYYDFILLFSLLNLFFLPLKVGVISDFLMVFIFLFEKLYLNIKMPFCLFAYVIWCSLSYLWMGGDKVYGIVTSFGYTLLPVVFFLIGRKIDNSKKQLYFQRMLLSIRIILGVSLLLHIFQPEFYCDYLKAKGWINFYSYEAARMEAKYGMHGLLGATATGFFCCVLIIVDFRRYLWGKSTFLSIIILMIDFLFLMENSRKSAILLTIVIIIVEMVNYLKIKRIFSVKLLYICALCVFLLLSVLLYCSYRGVKISFVSDLLNRFTVEEWTYAISHRNSISNNTISNMKPYMFLIGNGFGSAGHRTIEELGIYIYDNNWLLIFVETGIIGLVLFICAIIENIQYKVLNKKGIPIELYIVFVVLVQSFASNMIENQFITPMFFFSLGCCSNRLLLDDPVEICL